MNAFMEVMIGRQLTDIAKELRHRRVKALRRALEDIQQAEPGEAKFIAQAALRCDRADFEETAEVMLEKARQLEREYES